MIDSAAPLLCPAISGLAFAFAQRRAVRRTVNPKALPASSGKSIPLGSDIFAALTGLYLFCLFFTLVGRPAASVFLALSVLLLLLFVNQAKEKVLHEPLVLADACLLGQVFRFPHLYFPFLPTRLIIAVAISSCVLLALLLCFENSFGYAARAALLPTALLPPALFYAMNRGWMAWLADWLLRLFPLSCDATVDAGRLGPLSAALLHPVLAGRMRRQKPDFLSRCGRAAMDSRWPIDLSAALSAPERPHALLVQAESFCDVREQLPEESRAALRELLPNWERLKALGRAFEPPAEAYGAYTMRREFQVLTGLGAEALGPWGLNPYLLAARQPLWSLARQFRAKGYAAWCVHPYSKDFFRRDLVMPNLGFERFVGLEELGHLPKFGPYVSDLALADWVLEELKKSGNPVFCFIITMEAHGPWLPGRLTEERIAETLRGADVERENVALRQYLCHLKRMDDMFGMLDGGDGRMVWAYGDHRPGVPGISL